MQIPALVEGIFTEVKNILLDAEESQDDGEANVKRRKSEWIKSKKEKMIQATKTQPKQKVNAGKKEITAHLILSFSIVDRRRKRQAHLTDKIYPSKDDAKDDIFNYLTTAKRTILIQTRCS